MYFPRKSALALAVTATFAGGAFTTASAGTASVTYNTYATESATAGTLGNVKSPEISYQPQKLIAQKTSFTIYIKLKDGATWNRSGSNAPTASTIEGNATYKDNSSNSEQPTNVSFSSNDTVMALTFKATNNKNGFNTSGRLNLTSTSHLVNLSNASGLSTAGTKLKADFALVNGHKANTVAIYPSNPTDTATGTIADSQPGIKIVPVNSSNFPHQYIQATNETVQIDVNANPPLTALTSNGLASSNNAVNFGAVYIKNEPGTQIDGNGNDYSVNTDVGQVKVSLSSNSKFLTNGQEKFALESNASCSGTSFSGSPKTPGSNSSINLTGNFSSGTATSYNHYPVYGCMFVSSTPNSGNIEQLKPTQPQIKSLKVYSSGNNPTVVDTLKSPFSLYDLKANGAQVTMINFVPSGNSGYQTYIRVANQGNAKNVPFKVTILDPNGNRMGHGVLPKKLNPHASATYSASTIEKAAGVSLNSGNRYQIRITAPTTQVDAQAYLQTPNGGFTNMTSNKTGTSSSVSQAINAVLGHNPS